MPQNSFITRRQLLAVSFAALLSPMARLVPSVSVYLGGSSAWLGSLLAFFPLLLLLAVSIALQKSLAPGQGMGNVFINVLGKPFGRVCLGIYSVWLTFYAGFILRSGAERFVITVYPDSRPWFFVAAMLILSLVAAFGTFRSLARAAELIRPLLIAALVTVFFFAFPDINKNNLPRPIPADAPSIAASALPVMQIVGITAYFGFLEGFVTPGSLSAKKVLPWTALMLFLGAALCVYSVGIFGAELTTSMLYPFFYIAREASIGDTIERIEAIIIASWVFADFALLTALFHIIFINLRLTFGMDASPAAVESASGLGSGRWLILLCALGALLAAIFISPTNLGLEKWSRVIVPAVNLAMTYGVFLLLFVIGKLRRRI